MSSDASASNDVCHQNVVGMQEVVERVGCNGSNTNGSGWECYRVQQNIIHEREVRLRKTEDIDAQFPFLLHDRNEIDSEVDEQHIYPKDVKSNTLFVQEEIPLEDHVTIKDVNDTDSNSGSVQNICAGSIGNQKMSGSYKNMSEKYLSLLSPVLNRARHEYIVQDSNASFFLLDGDSLLYEAIQTKTWRYGQQLHLFYIIELYICRLKQHIGRCEIVFFRDMESIWYNDIPMRVFRWALVKHLIVNCGIIVHWEWENMMSNEWKSYLASERPSFIFLHDGHKTSRLGDMIFRILTLICLADTLDVAFTSDSYVMSSKLYAVYMKTYPHLVQSLRKKQAFFRKVWNDAMVYLKNTRSREEVNLTRKQVMTDINNVRDAVFVESVCIYWEKLTFTEKNSDAERYYLCQWAHYFAVISELTLSERLVIIRQHNASVVSSDVPSENNFRGRNLRIDKFAACILSCFENEVLSFSNSTSGDIADLIDVTLYSYLFEAKEVLSNICFTQKVHDKYMQLINLVNTKGVPLEHTDIPVCEKDHIVPRGSSRNIQTDLTLADITSRLSEEYAGEIKKSLHMSTDVSELQKDCEGYAFDETYHWHSGKPLLDDIDRYKENSLSKIPYIRARQLRGVQKFNDFIMMYGETLDKDIKPIVIATEDTKRPSTKAKLTQSSNIKEGNINKGHDVKKGKKKKKGLTAEDIRADNDNRIRLEKMEQVVSKWAFRKTEVEKINDLELATKRVLDFVNTFMIKGHSYEDPQIYLLKLQYSRWQRSCIEGMKCFPVTGEFIHSMHKMLQEGASDKLKKIIAKYFRKLGYEDVAKLISTDLFDKTVSKKYFVDIPYNVFQMQYMGHLMKRDVRFDPDPRVAGFIPDTWQRELLDVVDNNESALIVAPTSSGKTFCSYYCMEKVLRESNDGIVVYVSPTKALVNQVHASIYARFRKNMSDGQSLVGVFTRDYQHNAMTCQILVTVPQCLEILLLSPKRQNWASRLCYVILDEIHCIGSEIGGEVWEHLITLIRCPFLALSATIGNPKEFHSWLCDAQAFKYSQESVCAEKKNESRISTPNVRLVMYSERYSDIQTSIYIPGTEENGDSLIETHPCTFLDGHSLSVNGFPSGMSLSPKESYQLWIAGKYVFRENEDAKNSLEAWCPTTYFKEIYVSKREARDYEIDLKQHIFQLIQNSPSNAAKLIAYFRDQLPVESGNRNGKYVSIPGISQMDFDIYDKFPAFIEKLKEADKLPVLVFMMDRNGIKELAYSLETHVNEKINKTMKGMQSEIEGADKIREILTKCDKIARDKNMNIEVTSKATTLREIKGNSSDYNVTYNYNKTIKKDVPALRPKIYTAEYSSQHDNLQRILLKIEKEKNMCNFVSEGAVSAEYLDRVLEKVPNDDEKHLLQLGISYHHAGCNIKFRRATEILFRAKHVQVVAATGTLALGIHMPCKTVVIVGDDHYTDALNYRQMSGRSGRRGFDNVGNVVFYGVPVRKISALVKADISSLNGLYPISCTLVLRLLLLASNSTYAEDAYKKALTVLSHPFFTHQKSLQQTQLQHFFLFVVDHLIRQLLIDEKGTPLQFAGLVSHLHYLEPGNMIIVYLLRKGIFHKICKPSKENIHRHYGHNCKLCHVSPIVGKMFQRVGTLMYLCGKCFISNNSDQAAGRNHTKGEFIAVIPPLKHTYPDSTLRGLVCVLCHIFCNRRIPNIFLEHDNSGTLKLKEPPSYGSRVLLDPLPSNFVDAINTYNEAVKVNFANYLCVVSRSVDKEGYVSLPLSCKRWKLDTEEYCSEGTSAIMPFVQMSGCSNEHLKMFALCPDENFRLLLPEVFMDFKSIPAINLEVPMNAYALDFFKHNNLRALEADNRIQKGEVFSTLKDFMLLTKVIATSLEELGPTETDDHVIGAFKHLAFEYRERFSAAYPEARRVEF